MKTRKIILDYIFLISFWAAIHCALGGCYAIKNPVPQKHKMYAHYNGDIIPVYVEYNVREFKVGDITITDLYYFDRNRASGIDNEGREVIINRQITLDGLFLYELNVQGGYRIIVTFQPLRCPRDSLSCSQLTL